MRQCLMLSGMLKNAETWINILESDMTKLTMPDTMLQRMLLSSSGNPSKVFMNLELGVIPVKYVLMAKRLNMWQYILNEDISLTIHQVYLALKCENRKGDFYSFIQKDLKDLNIQLEEASKRNMSKHNGKFLSNQLLKIRLFNTWYMKTQKLKRTKTLCLKN